MDSLPLITLSELKAMLQVRNEVTTMDARFNLFIDAATKAIEQATGRSFTKQAHTEFFTARDNQRIDYNLTSGFADAPGTLTRTSPQTCYLKGHVIDPDTPVSVWYDPTGLTYDEGHLLVEGQDYVVDYENDAIIIVAGTSYKPRAIKIEYTAGWPGAGTPPTLSGAADSLLKLAALTQAQFMNVKLRNDNVGMGTERTTNAKDRVFASEFLAVSGLTPEVARMVAPLRRVQTGSL